ncbi:Ferric reductase [Phytophthora cinnamomi]|uniref:Ferric reductase n=1 Tax=Phytophthora cinnamomi TaxID=4785 RepID=UPI00355A2E80|nr:Ferric reductase [Phytophthora cinnamomi]
MDASPKASNFTEVSTPTAPIPLATPVSSSPYESWQPRERCSCLPGRLQTVLRSWMVTRWSLSRRVFSVPVPGLTASFDVKRGDLVLTLPVVAILVVVNAILAGSRSVGGSGTIATLGLLLVFFFAIRNNVLLLELTGISFERALFYHKLFAYTTIVLSALHGLSYLLAHHHGDEQGKGSKVTSGTIMFVGMVLMFAMSLNFIRRRFFELFLRVHWVLLLVVFIVGMAHGAALALVGIVPWIIDLLFRMVYRTRIYKQGALLKKKDADNANADSNRNVLNASNGMGVIARDQLSVKALPGNITRVSFPRVRKDTGEVFEFEAGQFAFLALLDNAPNGDEGAASAGYFPHEIVRSEDDNTFASELYLTDVERDAENPVEQQLGHCIRYGSRPDIAAILRSLGGQAKQDGKDRVAVLACGPMPMVQAVLTTSMAISQEMKVQFDVHTELFEF